MRKTALLAVLLVLISGLVFAQSSEPAETPQPQAETPQSPAETPPTSQEGQVIEPEKSEPSAATYLKANVIHGDFNLYGFGYYFNDMSVEIEHHWSRRHLGLSGFSFGYRKEDFSSAEYGHFLNSRIFWKAEKHGFYFKPGIGVEWGKPSPRFEQTRFLYSGGALVSYERIYRKRNAWMPVGVQNTGTLNPFFEIGIGQKAGIFLFEGGARIGYDEFTINTLRFKNGDLVFQGLKREHNFIPTLYVGIGLRMF